MYINRLNARIAAMRSTIEKKELARIKSRNDTLNTLARLNPQANSAETITPEKSVVIEALQWDQDKQSPLDSQN